MDDHSACVYPYGSAQVGWDMKAERKNTDFVPASSFTIPYLLYYTSEIYFMYHSFDHSIDSYVETQFVLNKR